MHNVLSVLSCLGRVSNNVYDGHEFGVCTRDAAHVREFAWTESGDDSADTIDSSITIGGISYNPIESRRIS
jgi:hypothetical protein